MQFYYHSDLGIVENGMKTGQLKAKTILPIVLKIQFTSVGTDRFQATIF